MAIAIIIQFLMAAGDPPWWDYPGLELWKFINLGIFVLGIAYVLTRKVKLGEAFKSRRENIRAELAHARQERDAATEKLKEIEGRLARLNDEITTIKEQSRLEAEQERARIARSTEADLLKLREQAQREIDSAGKAARNELRRYTAEQSVRLAEEIIRREMRPEDHAQLITRNIEELGGPRR